MSTAEHTSGQVPPPTNAAAPRHPVLELIGRYTTIFRAAWAQRDQLIGPARQADELAFLPAAIELQDSPPHPAPRRAAWIICSLFFIALLWAVLGQLDIVAVAQGRIVVSQRSKQIQPLETSVVKAIHVKDGDRVRAGQLLIELDSTLTRADSKRVQQERQAALAEGWRARSLLAALSGPAPGRSGLALPAPAALSEGIEPLTLPEREAAGAQLRSEWADISAKLAKLGAERARRQAEIATAEQVISKLQTTVPMARDREADFKALSDQGFVAGHAGQDRRRERIELERDLATAQARHQEALAALTETEQTLAAYRAETLRTLRERETAADLRSRQLNEEGAKADKRDALTRLSAPVAGTVQQLAVHTAGGVVTPAQLLLVLVPDNAEVTAEVVLENKDVGFLREGQLATIKLETFPYTRYGTVAATVRSISADAVQDEKRGAIFPATLVLEQTELLIEGKRIKLAPGMNLSAEIKTGRRRVIDYLLSPVQRHVDESLKER